MYPPTRKTVFLLPEGLQDIFLPLQERCGVLRFIGMRSVEEQLRSCSPSMCSCDGVLSPATEVRPSGGYTLTKVYFDLSKITGGVQQVSEI